MHIVLHCFANARNDGLIFTATQSRYRSLAPLAATSRVNKQKKPEVHIQVFHIFLRFNFQAIKYQVPLLILRW